MKTRKLRLIAMSLLVGLASAHAQSVDDIIAKHVDAIGGKEKIDGIKSVYAEASMEVMGNNAPTVTTILVGKGYKSEMDFAGSKIVTCITPTFGWQINPMQGKTTADSIPADMMRGAKAQFDPGEPGSPLIDYAAKGNKVELEGTSDNNGVKDYKIKLTSKDSAVYTYYIDPTTYYIMKQEMTVSVQGQDALTTITFADYKKTDYGFVYPMTIQLTVPQGFTLNITSSKVVINKEIDPHIFDMPKM
jgi:outer membrane lipoprotein-sorting protein